MQTQPFHHRRPLRFGAIITGAAMLAACAGKDPELGPSRTATNRVEVASEQPDPPITPTPYDLKSEVPFVPPSAPRSSTEAPWAIKPLRPVNFVVERADSLLEDTCTSCGGAIWRTLLRNVHAYPQLFQDNMLLRDTSNGSLPKILLLNAKTGVPIWMRTLKSIDSSAALAMQNLFFLSDGTIAAMIEENRGGRANGKVILIGANGSRITEFDYDESLHRLTLQALDSGFLVSGERYATAQDGVERTYLSLHDAKGRQIGAWYAEKGAQVECVFDRSKNSLICVYVFQSQRLNRRVEYDAKTLKVISTSERSANWLRPFFVDGSLYHGVLEKPGSTEWSIFRVDPNGQEKLLLRTKRTLSLEMGQALFLVEYGGRERRYFPVFSKSDEPAHIIIGPENAQVMLGPGGDAFTSYEGIFARWAAEKGPNGSTIAMMKLLTR